MNKELEEPQWDFLKRVKRPALVVAPPSFLDDIRANLETFGIQDAVAQRDTGAIADWLIGAAMYQGISDANAEAYVAKHGLIRFADIEAALAREPSCPKLRSYWHFSDCGYRKGTSTCSEPTHLTRCPLPLYPLRKGGLNQAAYSLFLFIRDICDGDLVGWIDQRLAAADRPDAPDRATRMRAALLEPMSEIYGVSNKVLSMCMADLLLGGDPARERWVTTGASMIAVDTLVHAFLHRTGTLRRFNAEHPYGPGCYGPSGCAEIIDGLARRIDAREFNPDFRVCFPRLIQFAIWRFCAASELDTCNGNRIDDRHRCENHYCAVFVDCDRVALHGT
jgi:hypothetical protein